MNMNNDLQASQSRATASTGRALLIVLVCAAALFSTVWAARGEPGTIMVDTFADELNTDDDCSLREAIQSANTNTAIDDCAAGSTGADVIQVPAGTYTLTRTATGDDANLDGDLDITDTDGSLTIQGAGAGLTIINGDDIDRIIHVQVGAILVIEDIKLYNGQASLTGIGGVNGHGGAIWNHGDLTLNRVYLHLNRTTQTGGKGGAIFNDTEATLTIDSSLVRSNTSNHHGGGIYIDQSTGPILISNSTINGNNSGKDGGGIFSNGDNVVLTLDNVTVAANAANEDGGGLYVGTVSTPNTTITLHNTIVADNSAPVGGDDCQNNVFPGAPFNVSYSLIEDLATCTIVDLGGNQNGVDPNLSPLADNGGPTMTQALNLPSAAVENGQTTGSGAAAGCLHSDGSSKLQLDQRGEPRAQGNNLGGSACDMGAYEYGEISLEMLYLPIVNR
jgi:CSLREA domain-containing protein